MRVSQLFSETLREAPGDVSTTSHRLLLRAGYIRQLSPGLFSYFSPGWWALKRIQEIIAEELQAIGGQEVRLPLTQQAEIRQSMGSDGFPEDETIRFRDRRGREMLLTAGWAETAALLAASEIHSYRQLPRLIFQFRTQFRDEESPRGGLLRAREFLTADSYSFDQDESGLQTQYIAHYNAFYRIAARLGLPLLAVKSEPEFSDAKHAHDFMYLCDAGESTVAICNDCGYAALIEAAEFAKTPLSNDPAKPLEKVHTPGTASIEELSAYLGIQKQQTAKAVFYLGDFGEAQPPKLILTMVRGDMEANESRIRHLTKARKLRPAEAQEIEAAGCAPGFASPIGIDRKKTLVIVDDLIASSPNLVTGANEADYHLLNSNCGRDYQPDMVGNIALAYEGAPCLRCGNPLALQSGVKIGSLRQCGAYLSEIFKAEFLDEQGKSRPIQIGAYRIGVSRLLACIAEECHDDFGLRLPIGVAPWQVALVSLKGETATTETAEKLYRDLTEAGVEVLFDEREASPGVKFNDADLRGIPLRLAVSNRSLQNGGAEFKRRESKERTIWPLAEAVDNILKEIAFLKEETQKRVEQANKWQ